MAILVISFTGLQAQFSWKPARIDEAKSFFLADFGYLYELKSFEGVRVFGVSPHRVISELGFMFNTKKNMAIGFNLQTTIDFEWDYRFYAKLRFRKWLKNEMSIDIAPGIGLNNTSDVVISSDFHLNNWFALTAQVEKDIGGNARTTGLYSIYSYFVGAKISSDPGLISNGTGIVTHIILFIAIIANGGIGN